MKKLTKKQKIVIVALSPVVALVTAFVILCIVTMSMFSPVYLGRVLTHIDSDVSDAEYFPKRTIEKSAVPYSYEKNINASLDGLAVNRKGKNIPLSEFIERSDTTSFTIVKDDVVIYEKYGGGCDKDSTLTSFSMAKSVVSLLIGKALELGYIKSVNQPISDYITEFEGKDIGKNTIEDLLLMRSNIEYSESKPLWFGDDSLTYWHDDLRALALQHTKTRGQNGFLYNNYHPLLLGMILERSVGQSVSEFMQNELWQRMGAEHDGSWSLDSEKSGFEKMESGINFRAVDFIKIGSIVLHNGYFNGTQIISEDWLNKSTLCDFPLDSAEYESSFLKGKNKGYKYMWYSTAEDGESDIIAWGKSDQILYISPSTNTIVLRTGKSDGGIPDWNAVIKSIISRI